MDTLCEGHLRNRGCTRMVWKLCSLERPVDQSHRIRVMNQLNVHKDQLHMACLLNGSTRVVHKLGAKRWPML